MTQEEIWKKNTKVLVDADCSLGFNEVEKLCNKALNMGMEIRQNQLADGLFPDSTNPVDTIMKLGWIMIGSSCNGIATIHREPTQAQINKLDLLGLYKYLHILIPNEWVKYSDYERLYKGYNNEYL